MSQSPPDENTATVMEPRRIRFRIVHILYSVSLLASALATFGAGGIIPALVVLGIWIFVFASRSRPGALVIVCLLILIGFCSLTAILPALQPPRPSPSRMPCANNLMQIGLALHNYHDTYGKFPPAYVPDKNGKPMHSWRVLILPFLEYRNLYDAYDFGEPWDGPNNRKLLAKVPAVYVCPNRAASGARNSTQPSYFAVVGPRTAWPDTKSRQIKEIESADGTSQTLLVIEAHIPDVAWTKPQDLSFDEAMRLLGSRDPPQVGGHLVEDFFYEHYFGRNAVLVDGSVYFLRPGLPSETAAALLTIDDGHRLEEDWYWSGIADPERLKVGSCYRLAVFAVLCLFPLPWVWISPRGAVRRETAARAAGLKN